jgi:dehydrogenase/reductase SDR family protein 1
MSKTLEGRVSVVTGASRGIGKGIALGLGEAGATVFVTGRSMPEAKAAWPGTVVETAEEVSRLGGVGIPVRCDHGDDAQVRALFERVDRERGRLDVLVNNATGFGETPDSAGYDPEVNFWELPFEQFDAMMDVGLRSHYVASALAATRMVRARSGLIVNVSSMGATAFAGNVAYGVGKAGVDKLSADTAHQLKPFGVAVLSLWPPLTTTEKVLAFSDRYPLARASSPLFTGRIVAALAADPGILEKSGHAFKVRELALGYGIPDDQGALGTSPGQHT